MGSADAMTEELRRQFKSLRMRLVACTLEDFNVGPGSGHGPWVCLGHSSREDSICLFEVSPRVRIYAVGTTRRFTCASKQWISLGDA